MEPLLSSDGDTAHSGKMWRRAHGVVRYWVGGLPVESVATALGVALPCTCAARSPVCGRSVINRNKAAIVSFFFSFCVLFWETRTSFASNRMRVRRVCVWRVRWKLSLSEHFSVLLVSQSMRSAINRRTRWCDIFLPLRQSFFQAEPKLTTMSEKSR